MPSIDDIINRQFHQWEMRKMEQGEAPPEPQRPMEIVTVSREIGSRGGHFASLLAEKLSYQLVHREIVDAICGSSGYRKRIIASLDEQYRSRLRMIVDTMVFGQAVNHADYTRHLIAVVLSMARLGGVVLVGRGGNFILGPQRGFHIRFVCPREIRVQNLVRFVNLTPPDAAKAIARVDEERREMIRKVFDADIDDPHQYDMVINSAYMDVEHCLEPTIAAIRLKFEKLAGAGGKTT